MKNSVSPPQATPVFFALAEAGIDGKVTGGFRTR
jgi:hypothetical protein